MYRAFSGTAVKEGAFEEINLSDYLGKWVILVFYPMVCHLPINGWLSVPDTYLNDADQQDFTCMWHFPYFRHLPVSK